MNCIKTALISVSDKNGIVSFAQDLYKLGIKIISTGGTAKLLDENGVDVTEISEHTGFPEILDGRVKTLHPKVHGGILSIRNNDSHIDQMQKHNITSIDLVVVNLYPFEKTTKKTDVKLDEIIENIDIGGPSMIRSSAKNYKFVTVVVDPQRYSPILSELKSNDCMVTDKLRFELAVEAFNHTYKYDQVIAQYLQSLSGIQDSNEADTKSETLLLEFKKKQELRYGENPHQKASFYVEKEIKEPCIANATILNGKELSFNNIIDINAAWEIVTEFVKPACVVIKHTNPCGASCSETLSGAFINAYKGDPVSAFGCILGFNKKVDKKSAEMITEPGRFVEAIIAPDYDDDAVNILTTKRKWGANLRILKTGSVPGNTGKKGIDNLSSSIPSTVNLVNKDLDQFDMKRVGGGLLLQNRDMAICTKNKFKCVTNSAPSEKEIEDLQFAFTICKHVKSNAIVLAKDETVLGVGAGQMSRIDALELAIKKAGENVKGSIMASDAFFPFRDSIDAAKNAEISAVIQPGGSNRDDEVIAACNEHNISMIFTGLRHFKH